ncbi:hypothetical protein WME98_25465 [Sorangium sp. So ce296]
MIFPPSRLHVDSPWAKLTTTRWRAQEGGWKNEGEAVGAGGVDDA